MPSNRYLRFRDNHWHYKRRVPARYADYDDRGVVRMSLKTPSLDIARLRRDAQVQADDLFWASLVGIDGEPASDDAAARKRDIAVKRYKAASLRSLARGFTYASADELADRVDVDEIIQRFRAVDAKDRGAKSAAEAAEAEAVLGGVSQPPVTMSEAFEIYCSDIAADELIGKSEAQKRAWKKTKRRGVQYFIDVVGDLPLRSITRQEALQYYNWWKDRLIPKKGRKTLKANTANRDLGNVRKLYAEYFRHIGEESRENPFRNLSFKDKKKPEVPPFENDWVRKKILVPGLFIGLKGDAANIIYALIETGCRPGEIANLLEDDIHLDCDVPYISIRPRSDREIKTASSIRDIPLVGVSLEAMRRAPKGFPHYRDKPDLLSANLMAAFNSRSLFPTPAHKIYSFRHSFEKRMQEANIDYALRCTLMGHRNTRPAYGDGGSLAYRRDELLKIAHPVPVGLF